MLVKKILHAFIPFILFILVMPGCHTDEAAEPEFSSFEEELDSLVNRYVRIGAAIGIINKEQQEQEFYFGKLSSSDDSPPDQHTVFEVGSITKTFTGTLLASLIQSHEIGLTHTAQSYLPQEQVTMPKWSGREISIRHLATHSSGIPKKPHDSDYPLPDGYDPDDPYAAYTAQHIYEYLSGYCLLQFEPGTGLLYSNTGIGLIGHILGRCAGSSFEELISRMIFESLNLNETSVTLTGQQAANLAPGHDNAMVRVNIYHFNDIFQGAGSVKSTLHDMMIYLKANMGLITTPLRQAMDLAQQTHFDIGQVTYNDREGIYNLSIGLMWHIDGLPEGYTFYHHGGRTNGYMAYLGFDKANLTGAVILCNQSSPNVIIRFGEDVLKAINKY